jgi:hypothetical protein
MPSIAHHRRKKNWHRTGTNALGAKKAFTTCHRKRLFSLVELDRIELTRKPGEEAAPAKAAKPARAAKTAATKVVSPASEAVVEVAPVVEGEAVPAEDAVEAPVAEDEVPPVEAEAGDAAETPPAETEAGAEAAAKPKQTRKKTAPAPEAE